MKFHNFVPTAVALIVFCCLLLPSTGLCDECSEPGSEPITQERLNELHGVDPGDLPGYAPVTSICCCYNNSFELDNCTTHEVLGRCCEDYERDCKNEWYTTEYNTTPTATAGIQNVDNDDDGDWDEGLSFPITTLNGMCFCLSGEDWVYQYTCYLTPVVMEWGKTFVCESCED